MSLPIHDLIIQRCRELGLRRGELVQHCGYKNISKGIRRLEQIFAGQLKPAVTLLHGLPKALDLSPDIVQRAIDETVQQIAAEAEARYRASFAPAGYLLGTSEWPSQIFIFGITGGPDRWLKIPLDLSQPAESYVQQALSIVRRTPVVQFFGPTTGFIVNYAPDHAVRFDLDGRPVETLTRAHRPGEVTLYLSGRQFSAESLGARSFTILKTG